MLRIHLQLSAHYSAFFLFCAVGLQLYMFFSIFMCAEYRHLLNADGMENFMTGLPGVQVLQFLHSLIEARDWLQD